MKTKTKLLLYLLVLCLVDAVIPIPIIGIILLYAMYQKPAWLRELVTDIYSS
jgi:hypothetical protein